MGVVHKYLTPALPLQLSRGCYWQKCTFCIHYDTYGSYRARNLDKIINDIKSLIDRYNAKYFHFTDDCISLSIANNLTTSILDNNIDIRWLAYFRMEKALNKARLMDIYRAGGRVLEIGLESASAKVLTSMNKKISINDANTIINDASSVGLLVKLFMFHGYPGESLDDLNKTIQFTEKYILQRKIRAFLPLRNRFELLRGSNIYNSSINRKEDHIYKMWPPSGAFSIRAEYLTDINEEKTNIAIRRFVEKIREFMKNEKIYNTDDENVMVDLIVLDNPQVSKGWTCI